MREDLPPWKQESPSLSNNPHFALHQVLERIERKKKRRPSIGLILRAIGSEAVASLRLLSQLLIAPFLHRKTKTKKPGDHHRASHPRPF